MEEKTYLIKNNNDPFKRFLAKIIIEQDQKFKAFSCTTNWYARERNAIHFTSEEEAQATIDFIISVIDEEKEGYLEIAEARE